MTLLSTSLASVKKQQGCHRLQKLPERSFKKLRTAFRAPASDFSLGFVPQVLPLGSIAARQQRFKIRVILPPNELSSQTSEPHPPIMSE